MKTPTLAGTRPGGAISAAWAVMNVLGVSGYREKQGIVCATREKIEAGVRADQIAVVTPYSAQVRLLRDRLSGYEGLEVGTIDGLQGREKEAIVLSLVRSNERGEVGFLAELRRLNVAMTRARRHLCVIADSATIAQHEDIGKLVDWLQTAGEHRSAWGLGGAQ